MHTDELLVILLKLVDGNKDEAFQLVASVRKNYANKPMAWCIQKAIYDRKFGKTNPAPVPLPPPPPPNPLLAKPKTQTWGTKGVTITSSAMENPLSVSQQDLEALIAVKQKMAESKPSSNASRRKLYQLLKGDVDQARRLVRRIRVSNPDRSEQWAVDKAIYDIERDRR